MKAERKTDTIAIRKLMVEKGYKTISQLSMASGINRTTLGKLLDGRIQPSAEVMGRLVETLNIAPTDAGQIFFAE